MSDVVTFSISIPSDEDGFVIMQCEHCGEFFKCTPSDIESEEVFNIYCPQCGLVSDSYITDDVMELAKVIVNNYANDMINDFLHGLEKKFSTGTIKFKAGKKLKHEHEGSIYSSVDSLVEKHFNCCNRSAKINPLLKMSASYCPFCGVITFEDE